MTPARLAIVAVAAVLALWAVGAYNRLVGLRAAIVSAAQLVDEALRRRGDAVAPLVAALRGPLAGEHGALDALLAAQAQVRTAAEALRARPVVPEPAAALVAAEAAMASASSRVLALVEQQAALREDDAVAPHLAAMAEGASRLAFARQLFNESAATYEAAAAQFPTRLLRPVFGFRAAGRL